MANEKRGPGRPAGREFTHQMRVPMRPADFEKLSDLAAAEGKSVAEIVRTLIDRYLRRHVI